MRKQNLNNKMGLFVAICINREYKLLKMVRAGVGDFFNKMHGDFNHLFYKIQE
jgi:hypothetical protein